MKKTILKGAAMLLGGVLLGTLLMIAAYAIPSETVWENVRVSAQTLANEGLRYEAIDGYHASRLDDFTDAIMIGNAVLTTEDPVESAMTARHFAGGETIGTLMRYLDGEDVPTESYARYWHGYLAALKPLLMVMNLNSIRVLNMYAQLALVLWTAVLMVRRGLSRHVLGIVPLEPGCKSVAVRPHLGHLKWAEGTFPTPWGVIRVRHERGADGKVSTSVSAPDGVRVVR